MSDLDRFLGDLAARCDLQEIDALKCGGDDALQRVSANIVSTIARLNLNAGLSAAITDLTSINIIGCVKDLQRAEKLRKEGVAAFAAGQYRQSSRLFSEALCFAPEVESICSTLFCNRALCFYRLREYLEAEADSTAALRCNSNNVKALYRRALARDALGNAEGAFLDAKEAERLIGEEEGHAKSTELEALLNKLQLATLDRCTTQHGGLHDSCNNQQTRNSDWTVHTVPNELHEQQTQGSSLCNGLSFEDLQTYVGCASSRCISAEQLPRLGKHLIAADDIPPCRDLLVEMPVAHVIARRQRLQRCGQCGARIPPDASFWSCSRCAMVVFCSDHCRQSCWFHRSGGGECGYPWPTLLPMNVVLALRLARRGRMSREAQTPAVRAVNGSLTHFDKLAANEIVRYVGLAICAAAVWQRCCPQERASNTAVSAAEILRPLCQIKNNGIAFVEHMHGDREGAWGLGMFPCGTYLNHSCLPNISLRFEGVKMIARSIKNIPRGAPLLLSYGPQLGPMMTQQRRRVLLQQYHFVCECDACRGNVSSKEQNVVGLRCVSTRSCHGAVLPFADIPAGLVQSGYEIRNANELDVCCNVCGNPLPRSEWSLQLLPQLTQAAELFEEATEILYAADNLDICRAIGLLHRSLDIRQALLHSKNLLLGETHNMLCVANTMAGNLPAAEKHLRKSLDIAENAYPSDSTNVAYLKLQLADLLESTRHERKARLERAELRKAAEANLQLHFGCAR
jgi:tetratricopeptide (TPR) repeat protein